MEGCGYDRWEMRTATRLLLLSFCGFVLFFVGLLATFKVNVMIYGAEEFNGSVGPGFAVLLEGIAVGIAFAAVGSGMLIYWLRIRPKQRP